MKRTWVVTVVLLSLVIGVLVGCSATPEKITDRNKTLGDSGESNFYEAQQIQDIEEWKDRPGKIVMVYIINPVTGSLLVPPIQCRGVPASSTESLEPNEGHPRHHSDWRIPIDGTDVQTTEMAGRDGTFGDPVDFRQCLTVDGHYFDWPAMGLPYLVSSASFTFPEATVQRDFESEARLLIAEQVIKNGGCIDVETLVEIPCEGD